MVSYHKTRSGEVQLYTRSKLHILPQTAANNRDLYTECGRTQILFKNLEKHNKLNTELTWCEKMIGMDTSVPQHKATHKRLGPWAS
jgi:hypothetical protein